MLPRRLAVNQQVIRVTNTYWEPLCTQHCSRTWGYSNEQIFLPRWRLLSYGEYFLEVVALLSCFYHPWGTNCLLSNNRTDRLAQMRSWSQRCLSIVWVSAYWGCNRGNWGAEQGCGFIMKVPFWHWDGRIIRMDLFWDCFVKHTMLDFFLFISQRNEQNVFTFFCLGKKKSRPLDFNFFFFFSLCILCSKLSKCHRTSGPFPQGKINVFIGRHLCAILGGRKSSPWTPN